LHPVLGILPSTGCSGSPTKQQQQQQQQQQGSRRSFTKQLNFTQTLMKQVKQFSKIINFIYRHFLIFENRLCVSHFQQGSASFYRVTCDRDQFRF
jgi:hypothetical protein